VTDLPFYGDPLDKPVTHPLLGQRVTVTTARKGDHLTACATPFTTACDCPTLSADRRIVGTLVGVDAGGGLAVRLDIGRMRHCWPALDITATPR
jgi:hypothetical protein